MISTPQPIPSAGRPHALASTLILVLAACALAPTAASASDAASASTVTPPAAAAGIVLAQPQPAADPCNLPEVTANPTRPAWDWAASTTQCGIAEVDSGWLQQPLGAGVTQRIFASSLRYGLTPRLDLRWAVTERMFQSGGSTGSLQGIGDQWLSARYRFVEQGRVVPAMAILYAAKIPTANPAKGFGTGFVDHQFVFIASRDLGHYHFDFNTVGTLAGAADGHNGAAQFGLAITRPVNQKLSLIFENYGGPQPATPDRFGAVFGGATYTLRPSLVLDCAYTRTYTAGSPRAQLLFGVTRALRPGFAPLPKGAFARLLGR
jgi:hypothetical protein